MKVICTRGFGIVAHPETGEEINVEEPFETDRETYEALDAAYPGFEVVDSDPEPKGEPEETPLKDKPYKDLRQMAADADTDAVDGRSSKDEIIAHFKDGE